MKTVFRAAGSFLFAIALLFANSGCAAEADLVARAHFVGSAQLFAGPDGKKLKEVWTTPGANALRDKLLDRLSALAGEAFNAPNADTRALFRPLLDDLLTHESYSDFRSAPEMVIAVRLPDARAKAWDAALRQAVAAWKLGNPTPVNADGISGWQVKSTRAPQAVRVGRVGEWTVVAAGPEKLSVAAALIPKITGQAVRGAWLEGDLNLAHARAWLPDLNNFQNLPLAHFSFSNRTDSFVRTVVTLDYPKPHGWKAEPWRIPTNSMFDPLCSFTAIRGIAPLLQGITELRRMNVPLPTQVAGWGMRKIPFQLNYAFPSASPANDLKAAIPKLEAWYRSHTNFVGTLVRGSNNNEIAWTGLPLAAPHVAPMRSSPGFLAFDMFPLAATRSPAPKELFQQLSRDNLVMFDWEITEDRLAHWRQYYQIAEITTRRRISATNHPSARFILDVEKQLGECVTEATATSPTQISIVRKSHTGLNAFELTTLARWIDSTSFPRFGIFLPDVRPTIPGKAAAPGAVAPSPGKK